MNWVGTPCVNPLVMSTETTDIPDVFPAEWTEKKDSLVNDVEKSPEEKKDDDLWRIKLTWRKRRGVFGTRWREETEKIHSTPEPLDVQTRYYAAWKSGSSASLVAKTKSRVEIIPYREITHMEIVK